MSAVTPTTKVRALQESYSYRKDDRAMRLIFFWESLTTPTATFPEILMGLSSDLCYEYAYKI